MHAPRPLAGPIFTVPFATTTTTNPWELFSILPSANSQVVIHEITVGHISTGPAIESVALTLWRGSTASSTAAALTARNINGSTNVPTAGSSFGGPSSGLISTASAVVIHNEAWTYGQMPWRFCPDPCERPLLDRSQRLHVRVSAPAAGLSLFGTLKVSEVGKYPST